MTGPLKIPLSRERLAGFRDELARFGAELPDDAVFEGDFKFESGMRGAETILGRHPEITAIWAQNDLMAVGALKHLLAVGMDV
ncbi:MAG: LacI family transcriptional regulator, partial [Candidatus Limnocylindrales bacterium]